MATNLDALYLAWQDSGANGNEYDDLLCATLRTARYWTRDEDAASDVILKVLAYLPRFQHRKPEAYTNWIKMISKRVRLDRHRSAKVRGCSPTIYSVPEEDFVTPDKVYIDTSSLQPFQRTVASLILQGYTVGECAQLMRMKAATLRKRLQRLREMSQKAEMGRFI